MAANKNIRKVMAVAVFLFAAIAVWTYICMHPSKEHVAAAKARIEAYTHYELLQNGKEVLRFDEDTITLAALFMDKNALWPSCKGRLAASYNEQLTRNKYLGKQADSIYQEKIDSLDSIYADSKWKVGELSYYIHSHNVQDEGYNRICSYNTQETLIRDHAKKLLDSLRHVKRRGDSLKLGNKTGNQFQLVRRITYLCFYRNENGKEDSQPCKLISQKDGYIFQLNTETTPQGIRPICPSLAHSLATTQGSILRRSLNYDLRPDSLGYYLGATDSANHPQGHGIWQGYDGTYYEGSWSQGKREGFGFSLAPKKPLRIGEWKEDRFKGERLVYTTERIYGIDLSKYQHKKGRKKYAINWDKLRITHLGTISKKNVSGAVNYPIRFIYIKSTEGKSLLNPYYKADYRAAKAHGYKVGTYHFFTTITPAVEQARHFLKHSNIHKGDFPPVLDVEPSPSQIKKMGGAEMLFTRVRTWLRMVENATGVKPILYISQTFVNKYLPLAPDLKQNYQVWIARYGEYKPDIRLVYWQLCPDGRVAGIHGEVDINVFNGYDEAYQSFARNKSVK